MSDSLPQSIVELMNSSQQIRGSSEPRKAPASARDHQSEESIQVGRCRIGRRPQMMLAIRLCSGEVEVLPYATLSRISSSDPGVKLCLSFCLGEIQIEGSGLTPLYHYLCEHRVMEICQSDRTESMTGVGEISVHSITLKLHQGSRV